jgi:AraC family transcriptional regulator
LRIEQEISADTSLNYVERINRAIDFIVSNLEQPLTLDTIARVACFSPFHFHRVFKLLTGEPLNQFVRRLRLERALWMLSHKGRKSLTEIALACGFASSSDFSRTFKQRYGGPPSSFDLKSFRAQRREEMEAAALGSEHRHRIDRLPPGENPDGFEVKLRRLPARCVAYIRVLNSFQPGAVLQATERLMAWAEKRGLADGQWLGYMWDDPEIVAMKDCRYDVGLEVPHVEPAGEIGRFDFPPMTVAEIELRGSIELEMRALQWFFGGWLPSSGFVPADQPCFEAFIGRPFAHGDEYFELYAQLPVERA